MAKRIAGVLPAPADIEALAVMRWAMSSSYRARSRAIRRVYRRLGRPTVVANGPFRGMRFLPPRFASQGGFLPKILGWYESELEPYISEAIAAAPDVVIDIGSAEGYYAVGLARRLPSSIVIGFEIEKPYRGVLERLAKANDVMQRIRALGACTTVSLENALSGATSPFLICDCEGAEDHLIDPILVPSLKRATMIVELHETVRPGVTERVTRRFSSSHTISVVSTGASKTIGSSYRGVLSSSEESLAADEGRNGPMQWFFMKPREGGGPQ